MSYELFELEEFLSDEKFQDWVLKGSDKEFWTQWMLDHANKRPVIDEATFILKNISLKKNKLPVEHIDVRWSQLKKEIHNRQIMTADRSPVKKVVEIFNYKKWGRRAAVVSVLLLATIAGYQYLDNGDDQTILYTTGYGEKSQITLPDGSHVRMNANTEIAVPVNWNNSVREVEVLYGEAFFEIKKTPLASNPKFVVHTNEMDIVVLGTAFNVNNRRNKTTVALTEGKVNLRTISNLEKVMNSGDIVSYIINEGSLINIEETQDFYLGWLDNSIILNNIPLGKVALLIEDHFGNEVEIHKESLKKRVLTGSVSDGDVNVVIKAIESSLNTKSTKVNNKIMFN